MENPGPTHRGRLFTSIKTHSGPVLVLSIAMVTSALYLFAPQSVENQRIAVGAPEAVTSPPAPGVPVSTPNASSSPVGLADVDWASMTYPVNCGGKTRGSGVGFPVPRSGMPLALVFVSCIAGAGSPATVQVPTSPT